MVIRCDSGALLASDSVYNGMTTNQTRTEFAAVITKPEISGQNRVFPD
jgi:hypothetical protein